MTREKKELLKEIENIKIQVQAKEESGFVPEGFYESAYERTMKLEERLAKIRGYESAMDMIYDEEMTRIYREIDKNR